MLDMYGIVGLITALIQRGHDYDAILSIFLRDPLKRELYEKDPREYEVHLKTVFWEALEWCEDVGEKTENENSGN